jgi:hypothetical protein
VVIFAIGFSDIGQYKRTNYCFIVHAAFVGQPIGIA